MPSPNPNIDTESIIGQDECILEKDPFTDCFDGNLDFDTFPRE